MADQQHTTTDINEQAQTMDGQGQSADPADAIDANAQIMDVPDLEQVLAASKSSQIDLLSDVDLNVKIELGRTYMFVEDVLRLGEGCVVELDKLAGDPVDVYVNDRLVARGEVLVLNDQFCVRVNEVLLDMEQEASGRMGKPVDQASPDQSSEQDRAEA